MGKTDYYIILPQLSFTEFCIETCHGWFDSVGCCLNEADGRVFRFHLLNRSLINFISCYLISFPSHFRICNKRTLSTTTHFHLFLFFLLLEISLSIQPITDDRCAKLLVSFLRCYKLSYKLICRYPCDKQLPSI